MQEGKMFFPRLDDSPMFRQQVIIINFFIFPYLYALYLFMKIQIGELYRSIQLFVFNW